MDYKNNDITDQFLTACSKGDLDSVIHIYSNNFLKYKTLKSKFLSFLKINNQNNSTELLNPYCNENLAFRYASSNSHHNIIKYLLDDKLFKEKLSQEDLGCAIGVAISINDINTIKLIEPFIEINKYFLENVYKGFIEACHHGYVDSIKYTLENLNLNNHFDSFDIDLIPTDGFAPNRTIKESGFLEACKSQKLDMVQYLLSDGTFTIKPKNPILSEGLSIALEKKDEDLIKLIHSNIEDKNIHYYYNIGKKFYDACADGNLENIKYILHHNILNLDYSDLFTRPFGKGKNSIILSGFMKACGNGKIEVVEYLTRSEDLPVHINVKEIHNQEVAGFILKDLEMMKYLVYELNLEQHEKFMFISKEFESLFYKKKLKDELDIEIQNNESPIVNKRLKL